MKKRLTVENGDELKPEYDLSKLGVGVRVKYYNSAVAGTNLVLIEPDLVEVFPTCEAVNRALRVVADAAQPVAAGKRQRK